MTKILIVDDDTTLVEMLSEQLQLNEEFSTVGAELGAAALELLKKNNSSIQKPIRLLGVGVQFNNNPNNQLNLNIL